ncbi:MotA/TolQ/ExbB proton channel family protein [Candidatus Entotheonella palauensis]|uniref:MotA/TolQ/ExbB proton channel family protein n=1 Tax=Candidatus Entotheonella palauensis TaxID=93172 RepID=UPI000B7CB8F0|nr:MotA/TolQ/ExbB proton channel family protein [Candidatus Entotheonella palauensis]
MAASTRANETMAGTRYDPWLSGQELRTPLVLAVLLTGAVALTVVYGYPGPVAAEEATWLARIFGNVYYQAILLAFMIGVFYCLLQFIGVGVDQRLVARLRHGETPNRLLAFVSGRPLDGQSGLMGMLTHWQQTLAHAGQSATYPHVLETLSEHFLVLRERQRQYNQMPIRFTIWVLPLLGFIGTVVGITQSIVGLEDVVAAGQGQASEGLRDVLGGLQFAFDTTFLGLVFVVPTMVLSLWLRGAAQRADTDYQRLLLDGLLQTALPPQDAPGEVAGE